MGDIVDKINTMIGSNTGNAASITVTFAVVGAFAVGVAAVKGIRFVSNKFGNDKVEEAV